MIFWAAPSLYPLVIALLNIPINPGVTHPAQTLTGRSGGRAGRRVCRVLECYHTELSLLATAGRAAWPAQWPRHQIRLYLGEISHLLQEWTVLCGESIIEITLASWHLSYAVQWFWSDGEIPWIQAFLDSSADLLSCCEVESEFVSFWWVTNDQRKLMSELDIPKLLSIRICNLY